MTYHDRRLKLPGSDSAKEAGRLSGVMRGIEQISLFPRTPSIKLGNVGDDWRAVGSDIRKAMRKFEKNG